MDSRIESMDKELEGNGYARVGCLLERARDALSVAERNCAEAESSLSVAKLRLDRVRALVSALECFDVDIYL